MLRIKLSRQAVKFVEKTHPKHKMQIAKKLYELTENSTPNDSIQLKGSFTSYKRTDVGEYRIVYYIDNEILYIVLIAKRNDNEVYKKLSRLI